MAESNLKTTEIGVKMDPRLMAEVDLWPRIYGICGKGLTLFHMQSHFDTIAEEDI